MTQTTGPGLTTPPRLSSASLTTTPRYSTAARDSSFSFRPSIGSARRSLIRDDHLATNDYISSSTSDENGSPKKTQTLTIEEIVFDDFYILNNEDFSEQDQKEARERLRCIFSVERGQNYVLSLITKLTEERDALTLELRRSELIRSIVISVHSEKVLSLEYEWQTLVIAIIEAAKNSIESGYTCVNMATLSGTVTQALEKATNNKSEEIKTFLTQRVDTEKFTTLLSGKTKKDLETIIANLQTIKISREHRFRQVASSLLETYQNNPSKTLYTSLHETVDKVADDYFKDLFASEYFFINDKNTKNLSEALKGYLLFRTEQEDLVNKLLKENAKVDSEQVDITFSPVKNEDYQLVLTNQMLEFHGQQAVLTADSKISEEKKDAIKQSARNNLNQYFNENPLNALATIGDQLKDDLESVLQGRIKESDQIQEDITNINLQLLECNSEMNAILEQISTQRTFKKKPTSHSLATTILNHPINVFSHDMITKKNALDHAIDCHDPELIAMILANAKVSNVLEQLLHHSLSRLDSGNFKYLIAGAYLFDPENGGLYNQQLVENICDISRVESSNSRSKGLASRFDKVKDNSMLSDDDSDESDSKQSFSVFFNKDYQLNLTDEEKSEINQLILTSADDESFARFIKQVDSGKWAHPVKFEASEIRAELQRRYVGAEAQPIPHSVQTVLNKNLAIAERADRLATFYDTATHHICTSYSKDKELYKDKTDIILKRLQNSSNNTLSGLENEAENIANAFVDAQSNLNDRRPVCVPDPHVLSATQRHFANAKIMLSGEGFFASARRGIFRFINKLTGSEYQQPKDVLERPIATVGTRSETDVPLTEDLIGRIPLTADEKAACVTRATLARGAFKHTLEYLEARRPSEDVDNDKKTIMENYLQQYIHGRDKSGTEYSAANLINDLETANAKTGTLGKRLGFFSSKTARILEADLRRSTEILSAFC